MDEGDLAHSAAAIVREALDEDEQSEQPADEDGFWNFAVKAGEVPLSSDLPPRTASADIARNISSENLLKEDNTIHK